MSPLFCSAELDGLSLSPEFYFHFRYECFGHTIITSPSFLTQVLEITFYGCCAGKADKSSDEFKNKT